MALIFQDQRALDFRALNHANTTHVMPVAVASLDEGVAAMGALVGFFLAVRLLVIDHIAELRRLDMTFEALE